MNARCIALTLINLCLTPVTFKAILTLTLIASYRILAGAMDARIWLTLIYIDLTVLSSNSWYTHTLVPAGRQVGERLWENSGLGAKWLVKRLIRTFQTGASILTW
jgi:hypothetical protein